MKPTLLALVRRVHKIIRSVYDQERGESGVPLIQAAVLGALFADGPLSQKNVCEAVDIDRSSLSEMICRMEDSGLVKMERGKSDRRVVFVSITAKGSDAFQTAQIIFKRVERRILGELSATARAAMMPALARLAEMEIAP